MIEDVKLFRNYYYCDTCKESWTDDWSATCDDKCPKCNKAISPAYSYDIMKLNPEYADKQKLPIHWYRVKDRTDFLGRVKRFFVVWYYWLPFVTFEGRDNNPFRKFCKFCGQQFNYFQTTAPMGNWEEMGMTESNPDCICHKIGDVGY